MHDVLQPWSLDQLARQPESEALRIRFDGRNARVLFRLQLLHAVAALAAASLFLIQTRYGHLVVPVLGLLVVRLLFFLRGRPFFARHTRGVLVGAMIVQPLLLLALYFDPARPVVRYADFALLLLPLCFLLPASLLLAPVGILWSATVGRHLIAAARLQVELDYATSIAFTVTALAVTAAGGLLYRYRRQAFLTGWRRENRRQREREHMQREIDEARRIQLSMLPTSDPKIGWLDVAGISIPASEVGGDYYDYFRLEDGGRQAVVVADVAGHGLASGLLLTGIRSCLHLLHEDTATPIEVLGKLDRMLRATTTHRTFVTLLYAIFDRAARSVRFAAAGHPPLLCFRAADRSVEEHGLYAPPLGTHLPSPPWQERTLELAPGDAVVVVTDGLSETVDHAGTGYGEARLKQRLREVGAGRNARAVRDALLLDLWNFKGDTEQNDDVTVVVARMP